MSAVYTTRHVVHFDPVEYESYRTNRVRSLFNLEQEQAGFDLAADVPHWGGDWQIGAIYGPSGSGKTSLGRALGGFFVEANNPPFDQNLPLIEAIGGGYNRATAALAAVGLGTVPAWLRPYRVLSNGERFRAEMAALLLGHRDRVVLDEFTSVLDRQVAQVASLAFAKAWRRNQPPAGVEPRQIVVLTPHRDVLDWLQPDWVVETAEAGSGGNATTHGKEWVQSPPLDPTRSGADRLAVLEV